jgi:hypothetical protein
LDVVVPVNSSAVVSVPLFGGRPSATSGAKLLTVQGGIARYSVGSGRWSFTG